LTLGSLLDTTRTTAGEIVGRVASMAPAERLEECLGLTPPQQRRLWQLASPVAAPSANELLSGEASVFAGRNSLQVFSRFEKWFARDGRAIVGCNRHALSPLLGPGYFTVRDENSPELEFDYSLVPAEAPAGWPAIRGNTGVLARPVYGDLLDKVVWITPDVLVGAAFRGGRPLGSYFVLVRKT